MSAPPEPAHAGTPWYLPRPTPAAAPSPEAGEILVVDDTPDTLALVRTLLLGAGHRVTTAGSGAHALQCLAERSFDLVILDLLMPGLDGFQVLQRVRAGSDSAATPVIVMSALCDEANVVRALAAGANDHLAKPLELDAALARIRMHLAAKRARDRLARHAELHQQFLRIASHDLRGPLTTVLMNLRILARHPEQDPRPSLERALRNTQFSLDLLENLLEMVNLEGSVAALQRGPVEPTGLVRDVIDRFEDRAREKGIALEARVATGAPPVWADNLRLQQVLNNLVSNGLKFTHRGGRVTLDARPEAGGTAFTVVDTGVGIPHDEQVHLFGVLRKPSVRPTDGEKSTGLGLAIARRIVELHGGSLTLQSAPERGTTVRVHIPDPAAGNRD